MKRQITWMHPSYRDLVIDELQNDPKLRLEFLQTTGISGIKLALSDTGGSQGARYLPLLVDNAAWDALRDRCIYYIDRSNFYLQINPLFEILASSGARAKATKSFVNISSLIKDICAHVIKQWSDEILDVRQVEAFIKVSIFTNPLTCLPDLLPTWEEKTKQLKAKIEKEEEFLDDWVIPEWVSYLSLVSKFEPRLLIQLNFPDNYRQLLDQLITRISYETEWDYSYSSTNELQQDIDKFEEFRIVCENLSSLLPLEFQKSIKTASMKIHDKIIELREQLPEDPDIDELDYEPTESSTDYFDIKAFFTDL